MPTLHLAALESIVVLLSDEHELLALYVEDGFTLPEFEDPASALVFRGLARKQVDPYLEEWFAGRELPARPTRPMTPEWRRLLAHLQAERPPGWVTIGMTLLDASTDEQQEMLDRTARAVGVVDTTDDPNSVEVWSMQVGLSYWRSSILGIITKNLAPEERSGLVSNMVEWHGLNRERPCTALLFDVAENSNNPVAVMHFPAKCGEAPQ
jgi:hypothetical protein